MDQDFENILGSINNLPKSEQDKVFYYLLYKKTTLSQDNKELIDFMATSSERLKQWMKRTDKLVDDCNSFFKEFDK